MKIIIRGMIRGVALGGALATGAAAAEDITLDTIVRAETDLAFAGAAADAGIGRFLHLREPAPVDDQPIIRMNRDTLYSVALVDLSEPVTVTLPDTGGRYQSLHVIDNDHYMFVLTEPGEHLLTEADVGTRFAYLNVRTFADPGDPEDMAAAHAAQDGLALAGGGSGPFAAPDWNRDQLESVRAGMNALATLGIPAASAFGRRGEVEPLAYAVAAVTGWGGLPPENAMYDGRAVAANDGTPHVLTVDEVPVDAFWSVTVYNEDGYMEPNPLGAYSFNSVTAAPNPDGSVTIHFGGCGDGPINCLPVPPGWSYVARMYEPRAEILSGAWTFPVPQPVE